MTSLASKTSNWDTHTGMSRHVEAALRAAALMSRTARERALIRTHRPWRTFTRGA
jgi:hypothetical protein